jgi:hypothetical protein
MLVKNEILNFICLSICGIFSITIIKGKYRVLVTSSVGDIDPKTRKKKGKKTVILTHAPDTGLLSWLVKAFEIYICMSLLYGLFRVLQITLPIVFLNNIKGVCTTFNGWKILRKNVMHHG